ncbi:MAG: hypothetical protein G01um101472_227 [Parcubacteria group bacterium Gr01-1014_72]|nr:MAG: hypothetical protein G01um101472_227 [Parcubacteria group bacterium Gr01-1014_72]
MNPFEDPDDPFLKDRLLPRCFQNLFPGDIFDSTEADNEKWRHLRVTYLKLDSKQSALGNAVIRTRGLIVNFRPEAKIQLVDPVSGNMKNHLEDVLEERRKWQIQKRGYS